MAIAREHPLKAELYRLVRESPEVFEFIQSGSLDGMWYWDLEQPEHEWMSSRFWETFGFDPDTKQHLSSEWQDIIFPEDRDLAFKNFEKHLADPNHPYDQIVRYRHKNGSTVRIRCRGLAIRDENGKAIRMLGAHTDITAATELIRSQAIINAQKEHQKTLEHALAEKTVLLKEVNHRVKNNLQIISSLLSLQANNISEPDIRQEFEQCQGRVQAMALIHQLLYEANDFAGIELQTYFRRLSELIKKSFPHSQQRVDFNLNLPAQPIILDLQHTVPLGMVLNELLSNAYKHAFPSSFKSEREINVSLEQLQGNHCVLTVSDNGVGIPEHIQPGKVSSLGLRLAPRFARQFGGEFEFERQPLTTFTIRFPITPPGHDQYAETLDSDEFDLEKQ